MNLRLATLQRLVVLGVIVLTAIYLAVLRPLAARVELEDGPIAGLRESLAKATLEAGLPRGTDFATLSNRLSELRAASSAFSTAERESLPRLEHPPEVRNRLEEPFQLVEFLNESQRRLEELAAQAQAGRVTLTPGLPRGFPRYQPELARPELLWIQLATVNRVIRTAIRAGVKEVTEVSVNPLPQQEPLEVGPVPPPGMVPQPSTNAWTVLRVHLTTVGSMDALGKLLVALSLSPEELKRTGMSEELASRPALFIDQMLLRRNQLEAAEQAQLELVVSTVVARDTP
ncbi:MAG: hypothetical protein IT581_07725 [Verrucomicrobiales bacterium]|nr:hypothetical protein [Verrucomicrobiales bacterium]